MARYIDAEPYKNCKIVLHNDDSGVLIQDIPSADVQEVKYGKWLYENYECSLCGESLRSIMDSDSYFSGDFNGCNYCPNCGAKMKRSRRK